MKLIGLDVGTRRIGVATADSSVRIAVPGTTITVNNGNEFAEIARLARANNTDWFVVGLPRSNDGNETAQSEYVREFAKALSAAVPGAKIRFQDESLTSVEAENRLKSRKKTYKKEEIDSEAAAIILQDFIEHLSMNSNDAADTNLSPKSGHEPRSERAARRAMDKAEKKQKGGSVLKKFLVTLLVLLAAAGTGAFVAYSWYQSALKAVYEDVNCDTATNDTRCDAIEVVIGSSDLPKTIADNLEAAGVIRSSTAFQIYIRSGGYDTKLKPGTYAFTRTMDVKTITELLLEGAKGDNVFSLTILPGETVKSVKKKLTDLGYSETEVNTAFAKDYDHPVLQGRPATNAYGAEPLEGYLFGDTYEFYKTDSVEKIIRTCLDALWEVVEGNDLVAKYADESIGGRSLSLYEGITLASIVQKESGSNGQATVAQIFYSRLVQNLVLGSDVTLQYALDLVDPNRETYTDNEAALELENPYNTRKYGELTPGPICNPGVSALLAVANPTDTSYLYFLTGDDGVMYYSYTEDEHIQNIIDHCKNLCNVQL